MASEILISSRQVTQQRLRGQGSSYEFVMDEHLKVIECVKIESQARGIYARVPNIKSSLEGLLFELSHVRVNPNIDNTHIIHVLTQTLNEIGVKVFNQPRYNDIAVCYKPLGEISDNVRFYLNSEGNIVFLSPAMRPKLVYSNNGLS